MIKVFKPHIYRKEMDSVLNIMVEDEIAPGKVNRELSALLYRKSGLKEGALFSEYERAIEYGFRSLDLSQGDKVAISPLSSRYYLNEIRRRGVVPVFIDADPSSGSFSFDSLEEKYTSDIRAIVLDSPLGVAYDRGKIKGFGAPVLEDISCSLGASSEGIGTGTDGDVVIASFGYDKLLSSGGAFAGVREKKYLDIFKDLLSEGGPDKLLSDMNCALALSQFKNLDKIREGRKNLAESYIDAIAKTKHKVLLSEDESENSYCLFPVQISSSVKEAKKYLSKWNIEVVNPFQESIINFTDIDTKCANASLLNMQCIAFPLYPEIGRKNAEIIVKVMSALS